ncbi:S41 family peptidase [Denitrificimonas sp. JX-1]|uniref:S41 family peptidase n=1 Tax=Denitrificimonas halotolerans TaxID=3098930 RepID=A0ABU5GTL7_9GAMM|nr:S41 family peptidase [Denitrificimonas sp. JX-1]MDY7220214.1 S41 family peptidase [Denitrificimonas sp. JX-1]
MPFTRKRLASAALSTLLVLGLCNTGANAAPSSTVSTEPSSEVLPLDDLRTFAEVLQRIKTAYVEPIDDKTLFENAIKGMLSNLDPHSSYLDPAAFLELQESTSGEFGGLGIEVGLDDGVLQVVAPLDDSPAAAAGLEAKDLIIKINDQPTKGLSLLEAVEKMRGKPGTTIRLTISRESRKPFDVTITRAIIKSHSVKHELLDEGYGYIRVSQFQVNTGRDVEKAFASLKKANQGQALKGLILDLRNNPGGILQAAVEVTDHFLNSGLIVYTKGRLANAELRFSATADNASADVPLVVLINGGSASASEIVAGALQDHKRAVVMGTDSFGKGSVQTVLPLNNERALKLTTALYYTPNGRSIQAQGIVPDITVERAKISQEEQSTEVKEADLVGHLDNADTKNKQRAAKKDTQPHLQDEDYQVNQALNLLKGLNVLSMSKNTNP